MTRLDLHGRGVETIFHLVGRDENAITKSLGWCLSQVPSFLDRLGCALETPGLSAQNTVVRLQEHKAGAGVTDLEIYAPGYAAWIVEAKRGFSVPSTDQLKTYATRLGEPQCRAATRGLVVLATSYRNDRWLREQLREEIDGLPVHVLSWRKVHAMAGQAQRRAGPVRRNLLQRFQTYLGSEASMPNWYNNRVYVVSLNRKPFGGITTFVDVVEKHRRYFHPLGGGRGGWPTEPPNYLAFRYDGHVKSIHHVESYKVVDDLGPFFPGQPSERWDPTVLYELGPPIRPARPMRVGARMRAARRWCFIDTLLTSDTLAEALEATQERVRRISAAMSAED